MFGGEYMRLKLTIVLLVVATVLLYGGIETEAREITVNTTDNFQQILDRAQDNDKIMLEPGIYEGNFTINTKVQLIGKKGATLQGSGQGDVLTVNADEVTIENLQIEKGGSQNAGIYLKSNRNMIKNNKIYDVFHGIVVRDGYGNVITENVITSFKHASNKGYAIYLIEAPNSRVTNNFTYDTNDGIYISYSNLCEIAYNNIIKARYGIHTMDSKDVVIAENYISQSRNGLMIMQSYNLQIKKNFLYENTTITGVGIFLFDTFNSSIQANVMKKNNKGIFLENAIENLIEFNQIESNEKGIEIGKNSDGNQINLNNFIRNNQQVISNEENENEFSWDGYGNYWDNQQSVNISQTETIDYAYKSGDVFYHLTMNEAYLQIFTGSPAVRLWNMVEQFVPVVSNKFVVDEHPLAKPATIDIDVVNHHSDKVLKSGISWKPFIIFLCFMIFSFVIFKTARRERHE